MDELTLRRFKAKVAVIDDCWIWTGATTNKGTYGKMKVYGVPWLAHRLSYTHKYGEIPKDKVVDHLLEEGICTSTLCVRPSHLQLLTNVENSYKKAGSTATHYKCGHPRQDASSRVGCRICYNAAQRERYRKYADMGYYNPELGRVRKPPFL